jgi:hypothetical protein
MRQLLENGKVPPMFHEFVGQEIDPFFQGTNYQLSTEPVQAGSAENREGSFNLGPRTNITQYFWDDKAIDTLQDENLTWFFDENYSKAVANLVNTKAVMIGKDVEVTEGLSRYLILIGKTLP